MLAHVCAHAHTHTIINEDPVELSCHFGPNLMMRDFMKETFTSC